MIDSNIIKDSLCSFSKMNQKKKFDAKYLIQEDDLVAGIDEAGRGAWFGPMVVCAVLIRNISNLSLIVNDSKKISSISRSKIYDEVVNASKNSDNIKYSFSLQSSNDIDEYGLTSATRFAIMELIQDLSTKTEISCCLIDGHHLFGIDAVDNFASTEFISVVHGDSLSYTIGLASILAKEHRDRVLRQMDKVYPNFSFAQHKGYGTALHRSELLKYGITDDHRKSFKPIKNFISH